MPTYEEVLEILFRHRDEDYRAFQQKLLKNDRISLIGVRTPLLRKFAEAWKGEIAEFLPFPDDYYEVTFLKCAIAAKLPFREFCAVLDDLVPRIDNWATCDCFHAPCIAKHREEFLPYITRYLADEREFVQRFALVSLLHDYVREEYLPFLFRSAESVGAERYYVMMAAAWLISEVLVRYYGEGVGFLKKGACLRRRITARFRKQEKVSASPPSKRRSSSS